MDGFLPPRLAEQNAPRLCGGGRDGVVHSYRCSRGKRGVRRGRGGRQRRRPHRSQWRAADNGGGLFAGGWQSCATPGGEKTAHASPTGLWLVPTHRVCGRRPRPRRDARPPAGHRVWHVHRAPATTRKKKQN